MDIAERITIAVLIKYYGNMLTDKQRNILDMYVDNNLSLGEVSEELNISRQAVKYTIDTAFKSLTMYEKKLNFIKRDEAIKDYLSTLSTKEIDKSIKQKILSLLED